MKNAMICLIMHMYAYMHAIHTYIYIYEYMCILETTRSLSQTLRFHWDSPGIPMGSPRDPPIIPLGSLGIPLRAPEDPLGIPQGASGVTAKDPLGIRRDPRGSPRAPVDHRGLLRFPKDPPGTPLISPRVPPEIAQGFQGPALDRLVVYTSRVEAPGTPRQPCRRAGSHPPDLRAPIWCARPSYPMHIYIYIYTFFNSLTKYIYTHMYIYIHIYTW